jgi:hypothetical protein
MAGLKLDHSLMNFITGFCFRHVADFKQPGNITRQTMYVWRNIEAHSCNYCFSGKAIGITYSEHVFVALSLQHTMRMRYIFIRGLSDFTIFSHIIS